MGINAIIIGFLIAPMFIVYGNRESYIVPFILLGSVVIIGIILGIIGAVKDENKTFSIIGLSFCAFVLIFSMIPLLLFFLTAELGL